MIAEIDWAKTGKEAAKIVIMLTIFYFMARRRRKRDKGEG